MEKVVISWKRTTPEFIQNIRGGIMYGIGAVLPFAAQLSEVMGMTVERFSMICGLVIIGVRMISKAFGIPDEQNENEKDNNVG